MHSRTKRRVSCSCSSSEKTLESTYSATDAHSSYWSQYPGSSMINLIQNQPHRYSKAIMPIGGSQRASPSAGTTPIPSLHPQPGGQGWQCRNSASRAPGRSVGRRTTENHSGSSVRPPSPHHLSFQPPKRPRQRTDSTKARTRRATTSCNSTVSEHVV